MRRFLSFAVSIVLVLPTTVAQAQDTAPETPFVQVEIGGSLNLRQAPSTGADRVARLKNGTLLRNIDCQPGENRIWCKVETIDGGTAGWAAAGFLIPHRGADPSALLTPTVSADTIVNHAGERIDGVLSPADVHDFHTEIKAGSVLDIADVSLPDGARMVVFAPDGERLAEIGTDTEIASIEFGEDATVLVRMVELVGNGGGYAFTLNVQ